ncbi:aldo/keto reductase [Streptomyces sp. B6B3]|uniref:aldo/keto reductase n=1 Tax=Streptomyces sp. B6B3 TaxID=3153570 RepID=UPI00325DB994
MDVTRENWAPERRLGRGGITTSALGFGCWAIGGEWFSGTGQPWGWGKVDDDESVAALRRGIELGVTFFDTAATYGTGHSEEVLGRAIAGRRDEVVIATKWGLPFEPGSRRSDLVPDTSPEHARESLTGSLRRLGTDHVDLFQLHVGDAAPEEAAALREVCEDLVAEGLVRSYGWSTDDPARARLFAEGPHCSAVQLNANVFEDAPELFALCAELDLAAVIRGPLAMGVLTGKYAGAPGSAPALAGGDIRAQPPEWLRFFADGRLKPEWRDRFDAVREVLTSEGRTPAQGALAWLWARSPHAVPIPGVRTVAQAEENAGALAFGPLANEQLRQVDALLGRAG